MFILNYAFAVKGINLIKHFMHKLAFFLEVPWLRHLNVELYRQETQNHTSIVYR